MLVSSAVWAVSTSWPLPTLLVMSMVWPGTDQWRPT